MDKKKTVDEYSSWLLIMMSLVRAQHGEPHESLENLVFSRLFLIFRWFCMSEPTIFLEVKMPSILLHSLLVVVSIIKKVTRIIRLSCILFFDWWQKGNCLKPRRINCQLLFWVSASLDSSKTVEMFTFLWYNIIHRGVPTDKTWVFV